jgi:hypothetical protein
MSNSGVPDMLLTWHAEVAVINLRTSQKFSLVEYFMDKFSVLHISNDNNNGKVQIEIQFSHYQIDFLYVCS